MYIIGKPRKTGEANKACVKDYLLNLNKTLKMLSSAHKMITTEPSSSFVKTFETQTDKSYKISKSRWTNCVKSKNVLSYNHAKTIYKPPHWGSLIQGVDHF